MSPYKSKAQVGLMHAKHPEIAARWDKKYGVPKDLPEKAAKPQDRGKAAKGKKR